MARKRPVRHVVLQKSPGLLRIVVNTLQAYQVWGPSKCVLGSLPYKPKWGATEIQGHIQTANRSYFSILLLMKRHGTRWRIRVILPQMLIHSIVLYDSASWTLSQRLINIIVTLFKGKSSRKYSEPCRQREVWRIRRHEEKCRLLEDMMRSTFYVWREYSRLAT